MRRSCLSIFESKNQFKQIISAMCYKWENRPGIVYVKLSSKDISFATSFKDVSYAPSEVYVPNESNPLHYSVRIIKEGDRKPSENSVTGKCYFTVFLDSVEIAVCILDREQCKENYEVYKSHIGELYDKEYVGWVSDTVVKIS